MGYFNRYNLMFTTASLVSFGAYQEAQAKTRGAHDLPRVKTEMVTSGVNLTRKDPRAFILKTVREGLAKNDQAHAFDIAYAVILEANRQKMDPLLVLAVIKTESHFNLRAHGDHGEIGLMQIMPATAKWLLKSKRAVRLEDPKTNIRAGTMYLAHLRARFPKHNRRAVSAYNMGARNVRRLVASKTEPRLYADRVYGNYHELSADMRKALTRSRRIARLN